MKFSKRRAKRSSSRRMGAQIEVTFCEADLSTGVERFLQPDEIVTASAFFDLVSKDWIARFAAGRCGVERCRLRSAHLQRPSNLVAAPSGRLANGSWHSMSISAATRGSEQPPDQAPPPPFTTRCAKGDIPLLGATAPGDLDRKMQT